VTVTERLDLREKGVEARQQDRAVVDTLPFRRGSRLRIGRLVDPVGPAAEFSRRDHEGPTREKKTAQNGKYIPRHFPGQGKVGESGRSRDNRVYP
jgi:hypothetical protein